MREPEYVDILQDGTVKQLNPFTGTEVWTVAGRGNRPIGGGERRPEALDPAREGAYCVFCPRRHTDTPPEKARLIRPDAPIPEGAPWPVRLLVRADELDQTTAEFRRIPNLFEILSFGYWQANYGYELPADLARHAEAYVASPAGRAHLARVWTAKLTAMGAPPSGDFATAELVRAAGAFLASGHDVIVARRHFVDGALDDSQLAGAGTLTPAEHRQFIGFAIDAMTDLYRRNRYVRYVSVFQNWLKPAGASLDHLHKQLVAIDEHGAQYELAQESLRQNPEIFNERAVNYAAYKNLVIAENDHAVAFAGFGHRYPTVEIFSKSEAPDPWNHSPAELGGVSDLLHSLHAATGSAIATNEEWHTRPVDAKAPTPWRIMLKWRISTLAGFEGATKIYLNTIDPYALRDLVVPKLFALRAEGRIAPEIRIATEASCRPNPLRYTANAGPSLF
jgi:galactose-1-phosphate uridylyltransferase